MEQIREAVVARRFVGLIVLLCWLGGGTDGRAAETYPLLKPTRPIRAGTVVAWGGYLPEYGQTAVPPGLTGVVAIAEGTFFSEALKDDGTVVCWGPITPAPSSLSNVVAIAANSMTCLALTEDGKVVGWGYNGAGQVDVPAGLDGVVAVSLGERFAVALREDGSVVTWGGWQQTGVSEVVAVAAGYSHIVAVRLDGTVVTPGDDTPVPEGLSGVVAVAAGYHSVALKQDGTVVVWGDNRYGQTNVPPGLAGVVAISARYGNTMALKADGTVVAWGDNTYGQTSVSTNLNHVVAVSAGYHSLALVEETIKPFIVTEPEDQTAYSGTFARIKVVADGSAPLHYLWRKEGVDLPEQTNATLMLKEVQLIDSGAYDVVVTNSFGAVTSRLARLKVVVFGSPEVRSDGDLLSQDVTRNGQSTISMSTEFPDGTIYYTTNGSEPSFASEPYTGPFVITESTTIRAMAYSLDFGDWGQSGPFRVTILPMVSMAAGVTGQGTITVTPTQDWYVSGSLVTIEATPAAGWRFVRWQGDACGSSAGATVVMDEGKTVTAVFEEIPVYPLTLAAAGGGTIAGNAGSPYAEGSVVNLTAEPTTGWQFIGWQGDAAGNNPNLTVTMARAKNIEAVFGATIGMTAAGAGTIKLSPASGPYRYGSVVRLTPSPGFGSYFAAWGGAAGGNTTPLDFIVTNASPTISALFVPLETNKVNIYVEIQGEGEVLVTPSFSRYAPWTPVALAATPAPGWTFVRWEGDAGGTLADTTLILDANRKATAIFEALPAHILKTATAGGGAISGSPSGPCLDGAVVNLTAHPAAGWQFLGWQGDASGTDTNLAVTMDRAMSVEAVFGTLIEVNPVGHGSIALTPTQGPYPFGSKVRISATPEAGFDFLGWGNAASGTANPLDYEVTTARPAICAQFVPVGDRKVNLTVTRLGRGQVAISPDQTSYTPWTAVTLTATPEAGWSFMRWGGDASGSDNPLALILDRDKSISAYFAMKPYIIKQPHSATNLVGTDDVLSVSAGGSGPLTYQWAFNGINMPGATTTNLTLWNLQLTNAGDYSVTVANLAGHMVSEPARLTVLGPPKITKQPESQTAYWGKGASFQVKASGWPALSYLWYKDNKPLLWATNATLILTNLGIADAGQYAVAVSNSVARTTSRAAVLLVNPSGVSLGLSPRITIEGVVGKTYTIQYALDVSKTNSWITLTNVTLTQPVQVWLDAAVDTTSHPKRFYRVVPGF